ncbi:MAG: flagellar motor switch protein FliG [Proteobacteria bacterium]|nr:flagellar motor switch protein FliG [Pseudomonadota bacterium]
MAIKKNKFGRDDKSRLRDVAILLLSIGEDKAVKVFKKLEDHEIRDISREMSRLGVVSNDDVEDAIKHFTEEVTTGAGLIGTWENTERMLRKFMDEDRVGDLLDEMRGPAGKTMWEKLNNVNEETLAHFLQNEYPQTAALIISKIHPAHAANILAVLPKDFAFEIIERMLVIDSVPRDIIANVEKTLRNEFMRNLSAKDKQNNHEMLANIFNSLDRGTETTFMEMLEQQSNNDAEIIRNFMFTFDDMIKISTQGIQSILREADKEKLPIALKGANEDVKALFFENMSERASKILQEDIQAMGPVRIKDVDEAQQAIIGTTKTLIDDGQIIIIDENSGDEYI